MKKGIKTLLLLGLFSPLVANAATVKLDCPTTAKTGSEVTCSIKLDSSELVDGLEAKINASSEITYKKYTKTQGWSGTSTSSVFLVYGYVDEESNRGIKGNDIVLGSYTYTVGNTATGNLTVSLSDIVVSDIDAKQLSSNETASDTIRVMSNDNTLSNLTIGGATINFSKDVTTYNVEISSSTTTILATTTDTHAKVTGTGNKTLKYGSNKFEIVVTSEAGTKKTYVINVTRPDNRSKDNTLKELKLNNGTINFKSDVTTYNVTVDSDTTTVSATANDSKAKISGLGTKKLKYGTNKLEIKVTAENESTKTYIINVTRPDNRSSNNNLSELKLSKGNISFDKNQTNYEIVVNHNVSEITIEGKTEDTKSKVEGLGTKNIQIGENTFTIKVTAENEKTKEYKIIVIREKEETTIPSNNIKDLKVDGYELNFNSNTKKYTIKTEKDKLEIEVELENKESTYEIIGNKDLRDGSIIQIIVTDKEGNNNTYTITVEKTKEDIKEDENNTKEEQENSIENNTEKEDINYIPIIMTTAFVLSLIGLIVIIIKKRKK